MSFLSRIEAANSYNPNKLWWEQIPKTEHDKKELVELIEQRLENDEMGEFEMEYGKKEAKELEKNLKKRLEELKRLRRV